MDYKRIEILLGKYWDCLTSVEEEKELRDFFNSNEVPPYLKSTAEVFRYYETQRARQPLNDAFNATVLKTIKSPESQKELPKKGKSITLSLMNYARVAAVGLIVVTVSYFVRDEYLNSKVQPVIEDTFEDPKIAFEETKKALLMISKSLGKGRKQTAKISVFNEAEQKVKNKNHDL